jgi:hypothetical protein
VHPLSPIPGGKRLKGLNNQEKIAYNFQAAIEKNPAGLKSFLISASVRS